MKKAKSLIAIALTILLASIVLTLSACNESKENALKKYEDFIANTLNDSNHRLTSYINDKVMFIEQIDGEKSRAQINTSDSEIYTFKNGNKYIYAMKYNSGTDESGAPSYTKVYYESENLYNLNHKGYMFYLKIAYEVPEDGTTFRCSVSGDNLEMVVKNTESGSTLTINIVKKNDLIESFSITSEGETEDGEKQASVWRFNFSYGGASVTPPDLTDGWVLDEE